jgi:hypothetical protein
MQEPKPLGSTAADPRTVGHQFIPQRAVAEEAARCAQSPALVDLGKFVAVIGGLIIRTPPGSGASSRNRAKRRSRLNSCSIVAGPYPNRP